MAQEDEYVERVNRVMDYIDARLTDDLSLETLSTVGNFSPYYFHRIFRKLTGETVKEYTERVRIERAAHLLVVDPARSVTDVAFDTGFGNPGSFARVFRKHFGMNARTWKEGGFAKSKKCEVDDKKWEECFAEFAYTSDNKHHWRLTMKTATKTNFATVTVKELPPMNVAYVRDVGSYAAFDARFDALLEKLMTWAHAKGCLDGEETIINVFHDNPDVTDKSKHRVSVCLLVGNDVEGEGEIGTMTLPCGKYAVASFRIEGDEYDAAWDAVTNVWFPKSGYVEDDRPCFEILENDPAEDAEGKHEVAICVPVA